MTMYSKSPEYRRATAAPGYKLLIRIRTRIYQDLKGAAWAQLEIIEHVRQLHISN